ncbi:MAG: D-alanine--D-alanine ligase [Chloroflexota bacterium]|nr:D-alanine--D-alanine ligase [Chloroflexota bacterium]
MKREQEPPGVVVLYNASEKLVKGEPRDMLAEQGVVACAQAITGALGAAGYRIAQVPVSDGVELALAPYPPTRWQVCNLGEGLEGRLFEEARIAWALEAMGYRFTGSGGDAIARSLHKAQAKILLAANGASTPPWWLFRHPDEVEELAADLPFPLIVKPVAEDASVGVGPDAVVHATSALRDRVAYVVECYRQAALAEVFVDGREFNIALWGDPPLVLPLAEIDFSAFEDPCARIVSFAAKWEVGSFEYHHTPALCPAPVDTRLGNRIADAARRAWTAIGCWGYARVDIRVSNEGTPYVVEVNCNPDLSPDAGFYRAARAAGHSYESMVVHILETARSPSDAYDRASLKRRRSVHPGDHGRGWHLYPRGEGVRRGTLERVPV